MITGERVVDVLKGKGPLVPNEIRIALGEGDTYVVGAVLSELKSNGKVKISSTKKGSSPFYYLPEHEHLLERISNSLNEKDKRAMELLKEKKILLDTELDPLTRVALRSIKDFSKPLEVNIHGEKKLFFKYYRVPQAEAESIIKSKLGMIKPAPPKVEVKQPEVRKEVLQKKVVKENFEEQKPLVHVEPPQGEFEDQLHKYFKRKNIGIVEKDIIRRQSEIDFVIKIPSPAGNLRYFCKARSKKKLNDKDLASAFVEGNEKKMPILFLITGELTNRAKDMLNTKFTNITVNTI